MAGCNWISGGDARNATGRRALLVGISYSGKYNLTGTVRDVKRVAYVLRKKYGFQSSELLVLTDVEKTGIRGVEHQSATRAKITACMRALVKNVKAGDKLVLYFAGHGEQTLDVGMGNQREDDGLNENILPQDHATAGYISDDLLNDIVACNIPAEASLTMIVDCCHSGTLLDLPYIFDRDNDGSGEMGPAYKATESIVGGLNSAVMGVSKNIGKRTMMANARTLVGAMAKIAHDQTPHTRDLKGKKRPLKSTYEGNVVLLSACKDDEKSLTNTQGGLAAGAMTDRLIKYILKTPDITLSDVITRLRKDLAQYDQTPQLTSSQNIDAAAVYLLK